MNPSKNKLWFNFMCLGIALVAFTGCKDNKAASKVLEGNTTISAESTACFAQYKTELMKMLTKDELQSVYQGDITTSELKSDIKDSYSSAASYSYWWPGARVAWSE